MFVTLSLVVSVVAPLVVVIAALRRAPEAYENEQGLQIVKRSRQVKRVALAKKFSRSSYLIPEPTGPPLGKRPGIDRGQDSPSSEPSALAGKRPPLAA
jgi:hypothetical protein